MTKLTQRGLEVLENISAGRPAKMTKNGWTRSMGGAFRRLLLRLIDDGYLDSDCRITDAGRAALKDAGK